MVLRSICNMSMQWCVKVYAFDVDLKSMKYVTKIPEHAVKSPENGIKRPVHVMTRSEHVIIRPEHAIKRGEHARRSNKENLGKSIEEAKSDFLSHI